LSIVNSPMARQKAHAVIFQETYTTVQGKPLQGNSQEFLTAIMNEALLKPGLQPLDPKYVSKAIHARQRQLILAGDIVAAAKAGNKLGASLMLYGQIFSNAHPIETVQTGFKNFYVQAVFKIMSPSTSKILAVHTFGQTVTGSDQRSETIDLIKNHAAGIVAELCRQLK